MINPEEAKREFGQIYDRWVDRIYRFVYIKVNSKEMAEDLTAETFTKAWRAFEASWLKGEPIRDLHSFCYKTARNLIVDHYRSKSRNQSVSLDAVQLADTSPGIEEKSIVKSDIEMVMRGISGLKDDYQSVIIWKYLDEMTITEIADLLGKSEEATRVTLHRAMASLKKVLEA